MSNKIWDIQNLILDLRIFSVYGHGAWCKLRISDSVYRYMHKLIKWLNSTLFYKIQINVAKWNIELLNVIWNLHFTLWGTPEYDKPHVRHRRPNCRHTPSPSRRQLLPLPSLLDWNFLQPIVCQLKRKTTNRMSTEKKTSQSKA